MGESPDLRRQEIAALQAGIECGLSVIDTAEMYADGGAERVVGEALQEDATASGWSLNSIRGTPALLTRWKRANGVCSG